MNIQFALKARPKRAPELVERLYFAQTRKGTMSRPELEKWVWDAEWLRNQALAEYGRAETAEAKQRVISRLQQDLNQK